MWFKGDSSTNLRHSQRYGEGGKAISEKQMKDKLSYYAGKYWQWSNGVRFKVTGETNEYGDWLVECPVTGKRWHIVAGNMDGSVELTEEQAKFQPVKLEKDVIKFVMCGTCCGWKCGKEELRLELKLTTGRIPADEQTRIQDALRAFFSKYNVDNVSPYVHSVNEGIEISFISREDESVAAAREEEKRKKFENMTPEEKKRLWDLKLEIMAKGGRA